MSSKNSISQHIRTGARCLTFKYFIAGNSMAATPTTNEGKPCIVGSVSAMTSRANHLPLVLVDYQ